MVDHHNLSKKNAEGETQAELLLPEELYELVWPGVDAKTLQIPYSQVIMPLSALLEGDFFNLYIKTGTSFLDLEVVFQPRVCCSAQCLNSRRR